MRAFSLLELIITIVIISILATLSVEYFRTNRERVLDGEAQTKLSMIIAAERDFRRQQGIFRVSVSEADLNTNLAGVLLPTANMNWGYLTVQDAAAVPALCCAQATRTIAPVRTWRLCNSEQQPVLGTCGGNAANCPVLGP